MNQTVLNGKTALITGANSGIGRVTAKTLALQGYHVFLACRSAANAQVVVDEIMALSGGAAKVDVLPLDLGDLASVAACADLFLQRDLPLHLLILNAGLAGHKGMTASGFEMTFGVCHVGHFLLTKLLLPKLELAAPSRVVVVASRAHRYTRRFNFAALRQPTKGVTGFMAYSVAKLANVLFSSELAKRLSGTGVTTYALHPGVVATEVWRKLPGPIGALMKRNMLTEEQGAATTLYCATSPALAEHTGLYYSDSQAKVPTALARNADLAAQLWDLSEEWVADYLPH